jgi:hypothetical protein
MISNLLKPLVWTIIFTLWLAYTPFLPEVVPAAAINVINLMFAVSLIWYYMTYDSSGNWG